MLSTDIYDCREKIRDITIRINRRLTTNNPSLNNLAKIQRLETRKQRLQAEIKRHKAVALIKGD